MRLQSLDVILKSFEQAEQRREFPNGQFELTTIGDRTFGRATYAPGWRWSRDVGPSVGAKLCTVEHLGLVLEGRASVTFEDGSTVELEAGQLFYIPAKPHDSAVIGDTPYVSIHFLGADHYAKTPQIAADAQRRAT